MYMLYYLTIYLIKTLELLIDLISVFLNMFSAFRRCALDGIVFMYYFARAESSAKLILALHAVHAAQMDICAHLALAARVVRFKGVGCCLKGVGRLCWVPKGLICCS